MRSTGARGLLVYCADFHCSHSIAINADEWPDHVRLSGLETRFVCAACGRKGADVHPPHRARQDAANGPWICLKIADDFAVNSADNGREYRAGLPGTNLNEQPREDPS